ncbi:uncharacterized protein LOC135688858 [Rhopilema esculentum]|uniref:uncharacterized protein LOC135688858 n=1 Tax=Rhopilema esculentum TaxID=499914 RepID=UPI0031DF098E
MALQSNWNFNNSDLQWLLTCEKSKEHSITSWVYAAQAIIACSSGLIIFAKYNSISVLNLNVHIDAISNTWWIIYCIIGTLRAILNSINFWLYDNENRTETEKTIEHLITADWSSKALETLILCFALNYQRKYRSSAQINEEVDSYSKSGKARSQFSFRRYLMKAMASSGAVLLALALVTWIGIILLFVNYSKPNPTPYFWIYVGCCGLLHLAALWLTILIIVKSLAEGPSIFTKILLLLAVLLAMPIDIPGFIWQNVFTSSKCYIHYFSILDIFGVLKCVSYFFFVLAVRAEYLRLKQECQWAMLSEVQRFSF